MYILSLNVLDYFKQAFYWLLFLYNNLIHVYTYFSFSNLVYFIHLYIFAAYVQLVIYSDVAESYLSGNQSSRVTSRLSQSGIKSHLNYFRVQS